MLPISIVFLMRWRINSWDVNSFITRATFCLIFQINTLLDFSVYMFFRKQLIKFETLSLSLIKKVKKKLANLSTRRLQNKTKTKLPW